MELRRLWILNSLKSTGIDYRQTELRGFDLQRVGYTVHLLEIESQDFYRDEVRIKLYEGGNLSDRTEP